MNGPQNVTVIAGESATFNCTFSGTEVADWIIGGEYYSSQGLPPRHSNLMKGQLTVSNGTVEQHISVE